MDLISIYDRKTKKRLCFLENATNVSYVKTLNDVYMASFDLLATDNKTKYCQSLNYVEIFEDDKQVGLFRIVPTDHNKDATQNTITYQCEHVIATLNDNVLFGYHQIGNLGTYTSQSMRYVLDKQTNWVMESCDFTNQFEYCWENEHLLPALFSIAQPLTDYKFVYNTNNVDKWYVSLKKISIKQKGEIRYGKNMQGVHKTTDASKICTRLYPLGYGEGENQLTIEKVNNGKPYLESSNISTYGVIEKLAVDRRFQTEETLLAYGKKLLAEYEKPFVSYTVDASYIDGNVDVGDYVRIIDDEENISELMRIITISKSDIYGDRQAVYTIENRSEDFAGTIATLTEKQRINELYSQGSTNIDSVNFADNADQNNTARLRFYISDKAVRINSVNFIYSFASFRAYSKSASASGGYSSTSSDGGGEVTATYDTGIPNYMTSVPDYEPGTGEMPDIYNHIHWINTQHNHTVSLPSHSHSFNMPSHTHDIEYGIFNGYNLVADSAQILVDGVIVANIKPNTNVDIAPYLAKDDRGMIQRGTWHTVEIKPNKLTRVEASLQSIMFINPKGGNSL